MILKLMVLNKSLKIPRQEQCLVDRKIIKTQNKQFLRLNLMQTFSKLVFSLLLKIFYRFDILT